MVDQSSIERMGFWGLDSALTGAYQAKSLPVDCLHVLSGFSKNESYFVKRNVIQPPQELQDLIFPWLDNLEDECQESIEKHGSEFSGIEFQFF